jgi:ribosomal protein S18 acetylase RimI-like enzyme
MDELARFFAFERRLLERVSTRQEPFEFGVAYLDEEHPERHYSSFLRVEERADGLTAEALAGSAERFFSGGSIEHRLIVVTDDQLAAELSPGFGAIGYRASWSVVMSHRRPPDRNGEVAVREVPFAAVRDLIRQMYVEDPEISDDVAASFTEQQGKKERTIGARFFVGSVDGQRTGACELYLDDRDAQVENVGTLERFRNRGVARSDILRAAAAARETGATKVFMVADEDDWPRHLYQRLGFDQIGRIGEFLWVSH